MKRSRIALLVAGAATCVLLVPALAFGVGGWQGGLGQGAQAGSTTAAHHGVCAYGDCDYVDADGNGVCDNYEDGTCPGHANCTGACPGDGQGYVDADGDGVCDNWKHHQRSQRQDASALRSLGARAQQPVATEDVAEQPSAADEAEAAAPEAAPAEDAPAAPAPSAADEGTGYGWQGYCGPHCTDADGDGVCDNWENGGCPNGAGGYVDVDNNGVCDNWESGTCPGNGQGYVDNDGDGVCDNWSDGTCPGNGYGTGNGQGYGNGGHHGNGHHGNGHGRCGW